MKNYNQSNQNTNTGVNNTMLNSNNSFAERFKNKGNCEFCLVCGWQALE